MAIQSHEEVNAMRHGIRSRDLIPALFVLVGLLILAGQAISEDQPASNPTKSEPSQPVGPTAEPSEEALQVAELPGNIPASTPVYQPPRRGSPRAKVSGGLRGAPAQPMPLALAPGHVGDTISAQPSLFWYIDALPSLGSQLFFTLNDDISVRPLAEVELERPTKPGIHRIRLAELGVELEPAVEYEWSIALVVDPAHRSRDIIATGYISRVPEPAGFEQRGRSVQAYTEMGLWYDALTALGDALETRPGDHGLHELRNALLRQADLEGVVQQLAALR
jgi:hypothetical protein